MELLPEPRSAGAARSFVGDCLCDVVTDELAEVAVLLTSELVTNAIVHARTPMRLDVDGTPGCVRVTIADEATRSPMLRTTGDARLTGRGMHLVEALAAQWGVDPRPPGKAVWFELTA
jgi:anti-sigma regulatory factor (Ser/Thr protein kinase)